MKGTWYPSLKLALWLIAASMAATNKALEDADIYIVHMDKSVMPRAFSSHTHWYASTVSSITQNRVREKIEEALLYTYDTAMHGFSAKLTRSEAEALKNIPGHITSYPDSSAKLHTTHSVDFLGLSHKSGIWPKSQYGRGVIVAILDSGVWPESESFKDDGMPDIPARWKGQCESGTDFNASLCNKKLIGALSFSKAVVAKYGKINTTVDYDSPRDGDGHGTHTSSTAAGNYVHDVDYFGYAKGTARGVAPGAHLAVYKVGWVVDMLGADVLAGMDRAIADGADVLSLSLGFDRPNDYYENAISIGAFAAFERGVLVTCSAGNDGFHPGSVHNNAPWIITVGASTLDREFVAKVQLGNGKVVQGNSLFIQNIYWMSGVPLFYDWKNQNIQICRPGYLDPKKVSGKIVLCMPNDTLDSYFQLQEANRTGAAGAIIVYRDYYDDDAGDFVIPTVLLNTTEGEVVAEYATRVSNPTVKNMEFRITSLGTKPAPAVAYFSSKGPSANTPGILKPDVVAPGLSILAAWVPNLPVGALGPLNVLSDYNIVSGTSMSCPHVAGIGALVKAVHPNWSPAAIKSAIMTTAYAVDNTNNKLTNQQKPRVPVNPLHFGAGHVDPNKATDPGLVYDSAPQDHVNYLCAHTNYTDSQISLLTRGKYSCPRNGTSTLASDLNYPSFTAVFMSNRTNFSSKQVNTFVRTVTNVAHGGSVYRAVVNAPRDVSVQVMPRVLEFKKKNQQLKFNLTMEIDGPLVVNDVVRYGFLRWVDNRSHVVKSPLVALFQ